MKVAMTISMLDIGSVLSTNWCFLLPLPPSLYLPAAC